MGDTCPLRLSVPFSAGVASRRYVTRLEKPAEKWRTKLEGEGTSDCQCGPNGSEFFG